MGVTSVSGFWIIVGETSVFLKRSDQLWNYTLVMKLEYATFADQLVYNIVTGTVAGTYVL